MFNVSSNFQRQSERNRKGEKWQLFHAKDFQSLMHPCFTFCHVIGLFPYKFNGSTFEASKPGYILSIFVTCLCCIYTLIALNASYIFGIIDTSIFILPSTLKYDCFLALGCFIMAVTIILSGPRMRLLQTTLKISSRLSPESYQKLSRLIHTKDIIGFSCLSGIMLISTFTFISTFTLISISQIRYLIQTYINLVVFQMDMLYINCVCVLKACFEEINNNLAHMQILMANNEPHVSTLIYNKQRNPFLIMELKALKKQHLMISDIVQMLNIIFSFQLVATMIITFTDITFSLYYYILFWSLFITPVQSLLLHMLLLSGMAYSLMKTVLLVWACETGKDQALQISTSVHDVFNSMTDKQIKNELQLFSLQLLHCKNTFSVKVFTIDAKFLAALVGAIITYVLILFQFVQYSNACEEKTRNNVTEMI